MYRSLTMTLAAALMAPMAQAMAQVRAEAPVYVPNPNLATEFLSAPIRDEPRKCNALATGA